VSCTPALAGAQQAVGGIHNDAVARDAAGAKDRESRRATVRERSREQVTSRFGHKRATATNQSAASTVWYSGLAGAGERRAGRMSLFDGW